MSAFDVFIPPRLLPESRRTGPSRDSCLERPVLRYYLLYMQTFRTASLGTINAVTLTDTKPPREEGLSIRDRVFRTRHQHYRNVDIKVYITSAPTMISAALPGHRA